MLFKDRYFRLEYLVMIVCIHFDVLKMVNLQYVFVTRLGLDQSVISELRCVDFFLFTVIDTIMRND